MKQIVLIAFSLLVFSQTRAQESADIGIWAGVGSYFGDMTQIEMQRSLKPAIGGFVRYNFNPRASLRGGFLTGDIRGDGEFEGKAWLFQKAVTDLYLMGEFNFFKYTIGDPKNSITTYLLGGIGGSIYKYNYMPSMLYRRVGYLNEIPGSVVTLPNAADPVQNLFIPYEENLFAFNTNLGFGFKFNIGERMGVGFEGQLRKYYNDKLDNLDDPRKSYVRDEVDPTMLNWTMYTEKWHNNDWTVYWGVHVTYKFYMKNKSCPVYESIN
ncbi:DUF6089 family protein [Sunxiuqinia sp. A32]|uniref:DUF6089 family protein n=1 Tax=Sunxiuqinia sp. A32 TaxID=3461496 RepID=UPI0040467A52